MLALTMILFFVFCISFASMHGLAYLEGCGDHNLFFFLVHVACLCVGIWMLLDYVDSVCKT